MWPAAHVETQDPVDVDCISTVEPRNRPQAGLLIVSAWVPENRLLVIGTQPAERLQPARWGDWSRLGGCYAADCASSIRNALSLTESEPVRNHMSAPR
jgi:hypothetical protein